MKDNENINNKIATGLFWKFGERLFSQGVSFIVSLVLARLLSPDDYGAVAIVLVFIEIANVFIISGLNTALIQKKDINEKQTTTIFYCSVALGIILYILMFFAAPFIAKAYELPMLTAVIRVFAIRLPIASLQQVPSALISRRMEFKKFFFATLIGIVVSAIVGIFMASKGFGVWALVAQSLIAAVLDAIILSVLAKWIPTRSFSLKETAPLLSYGWKIMTADLIGTIFNNLNSMIIGIKYNSSDLAYYTKGKTLPQMFRNNIYTTLISVLFPAMSQVGDNTEEIKKVTKRSIRMLSYIIFPMMLGMVAVAEDLVLVLYTEKWLLMTPFIIIVCIECMISIIPTITLQILKATGHSGTILKLEFIKKPVLLASILVAISFGVEAVAWTLPINSAIELLLNSASSSKVTKYTLFEQLKDISVPLLLSLCMLGGIKLIQLVNMPLYIGLVIQILVGILIYVLLSSIFKISEFQNLLILIKSKFHR